MNYATLKQKDTAAIEKASDGEIRFNYTDASLKEVSFPGPNGRIYVRLESYSMIVCEPKAKELYRLGFFSQVADQQIFVEKHFDLEEERNTFISKYLSEISEDELVMETVKVFE